MGLRREGRRGEERREEERRGGEERRGEKRREEERRGEERRRGEKRKLRSLICSCRNGRGSELLEQRPQSVTLSKVPNGYYTPLPSHSLFTHLSSSVALSQQENNPMFKLHKAVSLPQLVSRVCQMCGIKVKRQRD